MGRLGVRAVPLPLSTTTEPNGIHDVQGPGAGRGVTGRGASRPARGSPGGPPPYPRAGRVLSRPARSGGEGPLGVSAPTTALHLLSPFHRAANRRPLQKPGEVPRAGLGQVGRGRQAPGHPAPAWW